MSEIHDRYIHKIYTYFFNPSWMGRGVIDVPVKKVAEYIKDVQSSFIWDKLLVVR